MMMLLLMLMLLMVTMMRSSFTIQDKVHARLPVFTTTSAIGAQLWFLLQMIYFCTLYLWSNWHIQYFLYILSLIFGICQWFVNDLLDHNAISLTHCGSIIWWWTWWCPTTMADKGGFGLEAQRERVVGQDLPTHWYPHYATQWLFRGERGSMFKYRKVGGSGPSKGVMPQICKCRNLASRSPWSSTTLIPPP